MHRLLIVAFLAYLAVPASVLAQQADRYVVPRTAHGHPDFEGVWATAFLTMLERLPGVESLVASPEQAQALAQAIRGHFPAVIDPHVQLDNIQQLAMVKGEYRTSVIVQPSDGRMPLTQAGAELAAWVDERNTKMFNHPEDRPLIERCMEGIGYAPIRSLPVFLPRQILQTPDVVAIVSEGPVALRMIHLRGEPPPDSLRSVEGYSAGHWEGDTLVVHTSHLRAADPARDVLGRPLVLGRQSRITERFTRVSETELFYQFTVADDELYTQPWTGEFSMARHEGPIYEYACHEGNYSLPNALRGGQAESIRLAGTTRDRE